MTLFVRAEFEVLQKNVTAFLELARALEAAADGEEETLRYQWFQDAEPGRFVVLEEYTGATAAFAHNQHCADLIEKVPNVAQMTSAQVHGQLTSELESWGREPARGSRLHAVTATRQPNVSDGQTSG